MSKELAIKLACDTYNYKWPSNLTSDIMFYEGYNISINEFNAWANNFNTVNADNK